MQQNKTEPTGIIVAYVLSSFLAMIFCFHSLYSMVDRLKGEKFIELHEYALWGGFCLLLFVLLVKFVFKYKKEKGIIDLFAYVLFGLGSLFLIHSLLSFLSKNFLGIDSAYVSLILTFVFWLTALCIRHEFFMTRIILKSEYAALTATAAELKDARAELAVLREENAALKAELEKVRQGQTGQAKGTTVNAQKWKDSMQAACELLVSIMQGGKGNLRSSDFTEELRKRCRDYHTDAERIAWRILPDKFKHGPGRPAENPGNPEHVEKNDDLPF